MNAEETSQFPDNVIEWSKNHKGIVGALVALLVLGIIGWSVASWWNGILNDGNSRQRDVITQYNQYQTSLSTCLDNSRISAQIASEQYTEIENVLTAIVAARYEAGADPLGQGNGSLISALVEAYPEIGNELWQEVINVAVGCRNQVADVNNELQSLAGRFDKWTQTGGVFSRHIRNNWPNDRLKIVGLGGFIYGREALEFIVTPLTTGEAKQAILNHTMPDQQLFPSSDSSPAPSDSSGASPTS